MSMARMTLSVPVWEIHEISCGISQKWCLFLFCIKNCFDNIFLQSWDFFVCENNVKDIDVGFLTVVYFVFHFSTKFF